jgi:multiple sugar transport system substrate-binding protein
MTWDHPRGYDPLVACSKIWRDRTGVVIAWNRRSLQDFESFPVRELAARYDLVVIDHPHVGQVTAEECLVPLDVPGREADRAALAAGSVGPSYPSYHWNGRQWAFPIDAATQVQAWRGDLIESPPARWLDMLDLARKGLVQCPMRVPHSLMAIYTLAGNLGRPCAAGELLIEMDVGVEVYEMMRELTGLVGPGCFAMDPIDVLEAMAARGSRIACAPLIYGYASYAQKGFRPSLVRFADIPAAGGDGPVGAVLGGTGIAVSSMSTHPSQAIDFAYWIASEATQRGPYVASGGQPGHAAAWEDDGANATAADFYRATRKTLDSSWVRPRYDGYMAFQHAGAAWINEALASGESARSFVTAINALYRESRLEVTGTRARRTGEGVQ